MLYPLKLKAPLKDYIWGGTKLKTEYNQHTDMETVAESWELACHKDGQCEIINGPAAGMRLEDYIAQEGDRVVGTHGERYSYFPLMIKLIDAKEDLSVQVHPDNEYALRVEGEYGKTELWYVLEAEPGASLIYGVKQELTKEEFKKHLAEGTVLDVCNRVPVKKGDVLYIEAGTLHAIGKGIVLAEIQQNANTTYRVYDYNRLGKDGKPRQLHIDRALDVINLKPSKHPCAAMDKPDIFAEYDMTPIWSCDFFSVYHFNLHGRCHLQATRKSFQSLVVLDGLMELEYPYGAITMGKGDSFFIPADFGEYRLHGQGEFILSMV